MLRFTTRAQTLAACFALLAIATAVMAQEPGADAVIPHAQDRPPGPALSPAEAIAAMTVPDGFTVELVASEPDLVNPVAMTFDERGRIWVTESLEYPRKDAGPGRDRVKVLEDTDGDGKADKFTIFADGLNIPSGIAVGHGGVWVANSPDILFYPDADRDAVPDGPPEVVVTGFGRDDTHELPNSLTWGPDGKLYGWNGVFNQSVVTNRKGQTFRFTCAVFRIDPETRDFDLFCEGTSNPWGLAINPVGDLFASACVIDHMWHVAEGAYYIRQGGPYPAFTWPMRSIVDHRHQKAAYCGVHYFDSDAYPAEYRDRLYFGNIHGNCINVDTLTPDGASYRAEAAPDLLTANDAWFMPVVQKTGPDGSLYVLDWYDRYHCYQDANRDPAGIDRLKGRLYRIRYGDTPRRAGFDLAESTDAELINLLASPNVYDRDIAQRLLTERLAADTAVAETRPALRTLVLLGSDIAEKPRMHALWALVGGGDLDPEFHLELLGSSDPHLRAWGVRAAGNMGSVESKIVEKVAALAGDESPVVRLQVAAAVGTIEGLDAIPTLVACASEGEPDELVRHVAWEALHPRLDGPEAAGRFVAALEPADGDPNRRPPRLGAIYPRALGRLIEIKAISGALLGRVFQRGIADPDDRQTSRETLQTLAAAIRSGKVAGDRREALRLGFERLAASVFLHDRPALATKRGVRVEGRLSPDLEELTPEYAALGASWGDPDALDLLRERFFNHDQNLGTEARVEALEALIAARESSVLRSAALVLANPGEPDELRSRVIAALGDLDSPRVADVVLKAYPELEPSLQSRALDLLAQRPAWSRAMLAAVESGVLPKTTPRVDLLRRLQESPDPAVVAKARALWGTAREGRDPGREQLVARMKTLLSETPGDPNAGVAVFSKLCGQCHVLHGQGQEVGPDITGVGRNDFEQLLSNVFDPSLVIGAGYAATTVATKDGRVLTGLLVEDSPEQVTLKLQGGTVEIIPRAEVDEQKVSEVSLMPEGIEDQLTPFEIADLFAYLTLDKPPTDPTARRLPGAPNPGQPEGPGEK